MIPVDETDGHNHEAPKTDDAIADGHVVILSSKEVGCWQREVLLSAPLRHIVVILDFKVVCPGAEVFWDLAVEFVEPGGAGNSHPDHEVL